MISTKRLTLLASIAGLAMASSLGYAYAEEATTQETVPLEAKKDEPKEKADAPKEKKGKVNAGLKTEATAAPTAPVMEPTTAPTVESADTVAPSLKINGFSLFNTYVGKQSDKRNGKGGPPVHFSTDASNLYFTVAGKAQGLEYMYRVSMQTYPDSSPNVDQNYLQFKTDYYAFRLGNTVGPEDFAIKDAGSIIGGAGGFETAAYENVYNLSAGVIKGNDNIYDTGKSAKIVFMGPEYKGFQFFAAYTPNSARRGDNSKNNLFADNGSIPGNSKGLYPEKGAQPYGLNNWALGGQYKIAEGLWSAVLSGAAMTENSYYSVTSKTLPIQRYKLNNGWVYQVGAVAGYDRWEVAAGYLNNGKARLPKIANMPLNANGTVNTGNMHQGNSGQAWNTGLAYTVGAYQFAGAYQHFWRKTDASNRAKNDVFTGTVDVNVFKGLKVYFELDFIRSKSNKTCVDLSNAINAGFGKFLKEGTESNSGTVAILGTKISF